MKTINQIAQEYGVHPMQVGQWKREIEDQAKSLFEGKRGPQPVSAESAPDRLYGEIGRLKRNEGRIPIKFTTTVTATTPHRLIYLRYCGMCIFTNCYTNSAWSASFSRFFGSRPADIEIIFLSAMKVMGFIVFITAMWPVSATTTWLNRSLLRILSAPLT